MGSSSVDDISIDDNADSQSSEEMQEEVEDIGESFSIEMDNLSNEEQDRVSQLASTNESIENELEVLEEVDSQDSTRFENASEFYLKNESLSKSRDQSVEEHKKIGEQKVKGRLYTRNKFWAWVLPSTLAAGTFVLFLLNYLRNADQDNKSQLSEKDEKTVDSLVQLWKDRKTKAYFNAVANYVTTWSPSLQAQMLIMDYTKRLDREEKWPDTTKAADYADEKVLELVEASKANTDTAEIYRLVTTFKFEFTNNKPEELPRYLAADLCDLALAEIINRLRLQHRT